jgi:hypothetical protein
MFETNLYVNQPAFAQTASSSNGIESRAMKSALNSFRAAQARAAAGKIWGRLIGRNQHLLDLNEVEKDIRVRNRYHAGIQAVAIDKIVGSLGRTSDFDLGFNPLKEKTRDRWLSVARARLLRTPLPPVDLIQVGERYFVRDGHHRISVARSFGEQAIDAEVTVWEAAG